MAAVAAAAIAGTVSLRAVASEALPPQETPGLSGQWTIDRDSSQFPREVGFDLPGTAPVPSGGSTPAAGRRGRGGSAGNTRANAPFALPESEDDAHRLRLLTDEVRNPFTNLAIAETAAAVTITPDGAPARTFRLNGQENVIQIDGVPVGVTAKRAAGQLTIVYNAGQGRELRYTYAAGAAPRQLTVDVEFVEHGAGDRIRRVYVPGVAVNAARSDNQMPPAEASKGAAPGAVPSATSATSSSPAQPAADLRPDADLKGLTKLGVEVEGLSPQATACGLSSSALQTAVSGRLTNAGFTLLKNSDEDTYVYVNVITTTPSPGLCISRYDLFLYTHTVAQMPYQQQRPVLVTVSLIHKAGLAGGSPSTHGSDLVRGVEQYVDQITREIRDANK